MVERAPLALIPEVTLCVLAGGEGRRMGGADKGLVTWQGRPLVSHVLAHLADASGPLLISANRNMATYLELARHTGASRMAVLPDDADLPPASGPLAGILTLGRHADTDWLQVVPCDSPRLPADLTARLMAAATAHDVDVVVPHTEDPNGEARDHWVCALVHRRTLPALAQQFEAGERKVSRWLCSLRWHRLSFADPMAFANINALESSA